MVWKDGLLIAQNGQSLWSGPKASQNQVRNTVKLGSINKEDLKILATGSNLRVIGLIPGQIITRSLVKKLPPSEGLYTAQPQLDLAKLAVYNRYLKSSDKPSRQPALGFIEGLGLKKGAVASTVSHDSHNLVVAGLNDEDMFLAAQEAERLEGGLVLAADGQIIYSVALPLGGLMSLKTMEETALELEILLSKGEQLGLKKDFDPFMTLAFMSLPVIPSLKLTVSGLVDVDNFKIVPLVF
jgi:adenine deaminase